MADEVTAAASFMASFLKMKGLDEHQLQVFQECLQDSMSAHYQHHWYPDRPLKGNAYRCIRINQRGPVVPLLAQAANRSGLTIKQLSSLLPLELTLWVDPYEVCYRIGEEGGSICILYEAKASSSPVVWPVLLADMPYEAASSPVEVTSSPGEVTSRPVPSPVFLAYLPYDKNHFVDDNNQMTMYGGFHPTPLGESR